MSLPVLTVVETRAWETASWAAGIQAREVIEKVGAALARRIRELTPKDARLILLAGKGHNGDDVRAAANLLAGSQTELINVDDPAAVMPVFLEALPSNAWIVDGLFGIGLNRALEGDWLRLVDALNSTGLPIISVDVPSGLDAGSGSPLGGALKASVTLTVGSMKAGLLAQAAEPYVGRLEVLAHVGLLGLETLGGWSPPPIPERLRWFETSDFERFPPARPAAAHKGTFGHAGIVAGSLGWHGAAVLAARGAMRACPGLVTVGTGPEVYQPVAAQLQAAMTRPLSGLNDLPGNLSALLIGPGLAGEETKARYAESTRTHFRSSSLPMIVDASALDWLEPINSPPAGLRVLTPHPGEAARLLGSSTTEVQRDRASALRAISARFGNAWVVLKGSRTLIGQSTGSIWVNPTGNPFLAQGGSGDLLAGFLVGLLAQPLLDPPQAIRYAVWRHGLAADELSAQQPRWTIEELADAL